MKVRSKLQHLQANKLFTDREEPRNVFWRKYKQFKDNMLADLGDISVLSYYGIGGIGKSSLKNQIIKEMEDHLEKPLYVDFDFSTKQDCIGVLTSIRNILVTKYHFKFSLFDLARYNYAQKTGDDISAPNIKTFTAQSELLDTVLSVAGSIPVLDIFSSLFKCADKGYTFIRNLINNHKKELQDIEILPASELYNHLQVLFANDLSDNLKNSKEPLVIFLDTYERLVNEMVSIGEPLTNDEWIRGEQGLIQNISNVFWVISGREKLKWECFDPAWKDALEQHMLGSLSETDGIQFLETAGVADAKLRKDLYDLTNGTPVFLDICVDQYHSLVQKGISPTIDEFGKNIHSLIERFARYMDDEKKEMVYFLALLQVWNDEMVQDIAKEVYPSFSIISYKNIKNQSIVTETTGKFFTIHQTVGDVLADNYSDVFSGELYRKVLTVAAAYCHEKMAENDDNHFFYQKQYVFYSLKVTEGDCLLQLFQEEILPMINNCYNCGVFDSVRGILDLYADKISNKNSENYAMVLSQYANFAFKTGKYPEAEKYVEESCKLYELLYGDSSEQYLDTLSLWGRISSSLGKHDKALDIREKIFTKRKKRFGFDIKTLDALSNVAESLDNLGQVEEALRRHKEVRDRLFELPDDIIGVEEFEFNPTIIEIDNRYGMCLIKHKRYRIALNYLLDVLNSRSQILGEKHPETLKAMENVAECLYKCGRNKNAEVFLKKALPIQQELLGDNHPETKKTKELLNDIKKKLT